MTHTLSDFVEALDATGQLCTTEEDCTITAETLADFQTQWGETDEEFHENGLVIHVWMNRQRFKGDPRKNIYVADLGDKRACAIC